MSQKEMDGSVVGKLGRIWLVGSIASMPDSPAHEAHGQWSCDLVARRSS